MGSMHQLTAPRKEVLKGQGKGTNSKRVLGGNPLALTPEAKAEIFYKWGSCRIRMREIARQEGLLIEHVEDLVWSHYNTRPGPVDPVTPTVRQSRSLHLIAVGKAA